MTHSYISQPAAILFDLDGTLVDSLPDLALAMNRFLAALGRRAVTLAELRAWVGDGVGVLIERALAATGGPVAEPLPILVERYLGYYKGHTAVETRPYPGVVETLKALHRDGHALGVCTNKPVALSEELLEALGMRGLFSAVVGGDSLAHRKPHGGHIKGTLAAMGHHGGKALMVGDSPNDVAAAKAAGIPVVAVSFGYSQVAPDKLGADAVIGDFRDLPKVLAGLV